MNSKKDNRNHYKQLTFRAGIYKITNLATGRCLLGSSTDVDKKWNSERFQLNAGLHPNRQLQSDWNELGENNFRYEVADVAEPDKEHPEKDLKNLEILLQMHLELADKQNVYNKLKQPDREQAH